MQMSGDEGISAFPKDDNLFEWLGTIHGSSGTVYEGVEYKISLKFGPKYPNEPPQVRLRACLHTAPASQPHALALLQCKFTTRVFHPNVDAQSGNICLDILTADKWSAVLDVCRSQPRCRALQ
jgi:ubiquitin-protein ligase